MPPLPLSRWGPFAAAATGLAITAAVIFVPPLRFAYRNPDLHLVLVTSEALIAMLGAMLVAERFRRRRHLDALMLAAALGVLSLVNLLFAAVPASLGDDTTDFSVWSSLGGRLFGAGLLAAAALVPRREVVRRSVPIGAAIGCALVLATIATAVGLAGDSLPTAIDPTATPDRSAVPRLEGHTAVLVVHALGFLLLVVAAVGFARRAAVVRDPLVTAMAIATPFSATARLNYMLFPSAATPYVYTGDGFRLLFYLVVLGGALMEIRSYWRTVADSAAMEARRAVARDLHDGIAQELAVIQRNLHYLDPEDRSVRRAREAADRGASAARRALYALSEPASASTADAVAERARIVADREDVEVTLSLSERVQTSPEQCEVLLAVLSEAITNAARHGRASRVRVQLTGGRSVTLRVSDDGAGFVPDAVGEPGPDGRGHGLRGMRARAELVGARLEIRSAPGAGTTVELRLA